jgi:hypothetical protein
MSIAQSSVKNSRAGAFRALRTPHLLEISSRPWVRSYGPNATLDDVPDEALDRVARQGFHAVWLMGVWKTGPIARRMAREHPALRETYRDLLGTPSDADVDGSPYAIEEYEVAEFLGGRGALARLRQRLRDRGISLVLDFVPNHVGRDHAWLETHPERIVRGTESDLARRPDNWFHHTTASGEVRVFAHGRDPHFAGWSDTAQVDYREPTAREAMIQLLEGVAEQCDGVRCDMAMLALADVFASTWCADSPLPNDFWDEAIPRIRGRHPDFAFLAEVYWGLDLRLHELGFDYTYDKGLYDRLLAGDRDGVRAQLSLPPSAQRYRLRFLENHDETRSRAAFGDRVLAAAAVTYSLPGLRFFFDGQSEGRWHRIPVQLSRDPFEEHIDWIAHFYDRLFEILKDPVFHDGEWFEQSVDSRENEPSWIVGSRWTLGDDTRIVLANLSHDAATGAVRWPIHEADSDTIAIVDELTEHRYEYARKDLRADGLPVELAGYGVHFLRIE